MLTSSAIPGQIGDNEMETLRDIVKQKMWGLNKSRINQSFWL